MPNRIVGQAGSIDTQFGTVIPRTIPIDFTVVLTSTFSGTTGYSWIELRGVPGTGFVIPTIALSGDLAYDPSGNTALIPGTICKMWMDRDQTIYGIQPILNTSGGGSGSGSGSGSGCDAAVNTVTFECVEGRKVASSRTIGINLVNNQLVLSECETVETDIGLCSPVTPDGTTVPVVITVCPTFTTLNYLDHDSNPQTLEVVTAITIERKLITVPIAEDVLACVVNPTDCCGSGSGSGPCDDVVGECTSACGACGSMSTRWEFVSDEISIPVCKLASPNDGNECRFVSPDLLWELKYVEGEESSLWQLVNLVTGAFYFIDAEEWDCSGDNILEALGGGDPVTMTPVYDCGAPAINSATIGTDGVTLTVVFSEATNAVTSWGTAVTLSGDQSATATYVSGDGTNTIVFTLSTVIAGGNTVVMNIAANTYEDAAGNQNSAIVNFPVTNNSTQPTTYSTAGTHIFTAANTGNHRIKIWGGGGGGGNGTAFSGGGGGGGGAYSEKVISLTATNTYTAFIGAAAAAQAAGSDNYFITAGDVMAKGGTGGATDCGIGGSAASSVGTTKFSGANGGSQLLVVGTSGGGGGSSAGTGADGDPGVPAGSGSDPPGTGGVAPTGGGNGGNGATGGNTGVAGSAPGGGGGGGGSVSGTGGAGALGRIEIHFPA